MAAAGIPALLCNPLPSLLLSEWDIATCSFPLRESKRGREHTPVMARVCSEHELGHFE